MRTVLLIFIVILLLMSLPYYHDRIIIAHLKRYSCNDKLYRLVSEAKNRCDGFVEAIRVETSTKNGRGRRYIIPILLSEFSRYQRADVLAILTHLGFTRKQYDAFVRDKRITPATDIILGVDGPKGKLYLDYGDEDIALKCLESDGKIKYYMKKRKNLLEVKTDGKISGYHRQLDTPHANVHGDMIYWIAEGIDGSKSYYTRPYLPLIDLVDFINFVRYMSI